MASSTSSRFVAALTQTGMPLRIKALMVGEATKLAAAKAPEKCMRERLRALKNLGNPGRSPS